VALYEYLNAAKQVDGHGVNKLSLEQFAKSGELPLALII
jgi:hypothetical protein